MEKNLKIQTKEVAQSEVDTFISQAIQNSLPVETMEKLFSLRERVKAEQAKEAYVKAISQFQSKCPVIEKTKKVLNKDGRTVRYQYAPIEAIAEQIKKLLADSGLSYRWEVENKEGFIKAIAIITHELGHSEKSSFEIPIDKEGFMTAPQKYASALTFAKRYSLCNALGISTGEEDDDSNTVNKEKEPKSDKAKITFLLRGLEKNPKTKKEYEDIVKKLTELDLEEKNYGEIVGRLELLMAEKNEYDNSKIQ